LAGSEAVELEAEAVELETELDEEDEPHFGQPPPTAEVTLEVVEALEVVLDEVEADDEEEEKEECHFGQPFPAPLAELVVLALELEPELLEAVAGAAGVGYPGRC